jgi:hypothetical protein
LITAVGKPWRRPSIYSPFFRGKLPTSYTVAELKQPVKITVGMLKNRCKDHQLVMAYWAHLKTRTKVSSEALQEFAAAIKEVYHQAVIRFLKEFIQKETACTLME